MIIITHQIYTKINPNHIQINFNLHLLLKITDKFFLKNSIPLQIYTTTNILTPPFDCHELKTKLGNFISTIIIIIDTVAVARSMTNERIWTVRCTVPVYAFTLEESCEDERVEDTSRKTSSKHRPDRYFLRSITDPRACVMQSLT